MSKPDTPKPNTIKISSEAALRETMELAEFYRNRNLILAEEVKVLREENEALKAQLIPPLPDDQPEKAAEGVH